MNFLKNVTCFAGRIFAGRITRFAFAALVVLGAFYGQAIAQSLTTGGVTGSITDASGATVPNATITLKSLTDGSTKTASTNESGSYRFTLLKPGRYSVTASAPGFEELTRFLEVQVGQTMGADLTIQIGKSTERVEITDEVPLVSTDPSVNTTFSQAQMQQLPNAGGDITAIAFTAPGVVIASGTGYGNFSANGLPATSNLFTVNGENDMDPYFNINNSGATNLTIGQNELQEATVITNAYSGQYGQLSGAQVTYVTMSGSNDFHGNLIYYWNGRAVNANDWFNNATGAPRPFSNDNQWAGRLGGPIIKNRTFFFVDNEGMRFILPVVSTVTIPTTAFANAVLANVQAKQPVEASAYQQMFKLWAGAPGASGAQDLANSSACSSLSLPGFNPATQACSARFNSNSTALANEYIVAFRIDQKISDNDNLFFRYKMDRGDQPTLVDPVNSAFNAISPQPSWDTQLNETHIFNPNLTNSFMATLSHYVAQFAQNAAAANAALPFSVINSGAVPFTGLNANYEFPQGRNITQYQFIDDLSWVHGNHSIKFGLNFRRYDISDHNFFFNSPAIYFGYTVDGLQKFADGLAYQYRKSANLASNVPIAMLGMNGYVQDEWAVRPNLKLTLALRVEHNGNPTCNINCFANFRTPWASLPSVTNADPGSVPYSSDIVTQVNRAFQGVDAVNWSPRFGFSWSPFRGNKTVISGGVGIFYDNVAAGLVDELLANPPVSVALRVRPHAGVLPFDPNGGPATWAASAAAFSVNKTYSQIAAQLAELGTVFAAPAFSTLSGQFHSLQVQQWNLQIQHQLSNSLAVSVGYAGNHSIHVPYETSWLNAFDLYGIYPGVPGIPASPTVANYGQVNSYQTGAVSNYNGVSVVLTKRFANWVAGHASYTWSHGLDEVSNGGFVPFGDGSLQAQINPLSLRANNYGNSDYDIRHNFAADFVVAPKFHLGNRLVNALANGWNLGGKVFWHSGLPFSILDGNSALGNGGGSILGTPIAAGGQSGSCGRGNNDVDGVPCLNAAAFFNGATASTYPGWSPQTRNQYRGSNFFDTDITFYRDFRLTERFKVSAGLQAFNVFNHPNFGLPDATLGDSTFGQISGMATTPTTPYGNFLGFDSSPRAVQLSAKLTF